MTRRTDTPGSVDLGTLITEVRAFVTGSQKERGPYTLVMLVGEGDIPAFAKWRLVMSAPWIDETGHRSALREIIITLRSSLSPGAQAQIGQFSVLRQSDPLLDAIAQVLDVEGGRAFILQNRHLGGHDIPYGIIVKFVRPRLELHRAGSSVERNAPSGSGLLELPAEGRRLMPETETDSQAVAVRRTKAYEFPLKLTSEGHLALPPSVIAALPMNPSGRVIVLVEDSSGETEEDD
jgi:hypothetical protein